MKQFQTVFAFTFRRQTCTRGWRTTTILLALLLFLLPVVLPVLLDGSTETPVTAQPGESAVDSCSATRLLVVDETEGAADWSVLNQVGTLAMDYVLMDSLESAAVQAGMEDLILLVDYADGMYDLKVLLPEETMLSDADAGFCASFLQEQFALIQVQKSGLTPEAAVWLAAPAGVELVTAEPEDAMSGLRSVLQMMLPYVTIMLLYFMVLFYGQSVATSAIAEKSSKLMDTFLVSVKPRAMMLGKVLAISLAAILQLTIWIAALGGGIATGAYLLRSLHPGSTSAFLLFVDVIGAAGGLFSPAAIVVAVAIMLSGFLLYCALAAVGGALASKPEELSSTNFLFTMALVISFLCCLFGGGMMGEAGITLGWLDWVPFTAMLATPSRVLLGQISPLAGLGSLALILAAAVLFCILAGRLYRMMSFYRGNPPTPKRLLAMLRNR